ncbi:hypothetical protein A2866_06410 [Candidatus Roizmanbacteria bacterium RIFCSPHIGHO2_01_FULL_39_8]|uniref:Urease accessory protein UreH-like transmembrane domain-containing protein n=1 Tax=Candidatus Roizmanbacteria bacterium RIFCSPHIGHO2_01_FULL_39_8 TaxID=1802033 RepID=A0A1F7GMZ5_9BACT|nr:MAG: hypothetical protein A2866_06410 [Candidatus Roizmanbacteria bacterium RIFCSPHIGHO2_01_FULL_39_8]
MNELYTLGFGLLLGIKHVFEADHLIAISTMLTEKKNPQKAALIGTFWGIGHTTTLFVVGLSVLLLRLSIPQAIAERLEIIVGLMLIVLGVQSIRKKVVSHEHKHTHGSISHSHLHQDHTHQHKKSFFIGMVHGFAGSGALMVLVLSLINSVWQGILYILLFGLGSTISMTFMSLVIGLPLSKSLTVFNKTEQYIRLLAGMISVLFGISIIYSILH